MMEPGSLRDTLTIPFEARFPGEPDTTISTRLLEELIDEDLASSNQTVEAQRSVLTRRYGPATP